ncbi:unnamed protein product [Auanema sp. JU1783]|nr:unnamed protein product [Auanema sp. JU1783]
MTRINLINLQTGLTVNNVLPPPNHEDLHVMIMAISYLLLFLLGTCGNVAVLTTIYHVVRSSNTTIDNTLLYVIVLSCVDFGVCLSLPFTVIDQILGFWMFGVIPCKLHAVFENFGKILSALIMTAMAFDRYAGVCHPQKKYLRSRRVAIGILLGLAAYALITLFPLLWSFTSRELVMFQRMTGPNTLTRMVVEKCTVDIDSIMFTLFTIYQFVLCYCLPLLLIAFFYTTLLTKLRQHARGFKGTHIPLMRISLYTLAVACFYFICWTPFWLATVFAVYLENSDNSEGSIPPVFVYVMYFIHALPFTNSAVNWILYGALNSQLQQKYRSGKNGPKLKEQPSRTAATCYTNTQNHNNISPNSLHNNNNKSTQLNGSAAYNQLQPSEVVDDGSDSVDIRLLSQHEPTFL